VPSQRPNRKTSGGRLPKAELAGIVEPLRRIWHRNEDEHLSESPLGPEADADRRIESLERRMSHLEAMVEGLQDAMHRVATQHDEEIEELKRRTEPEEMARALSEDARKRGL
jgi:uncharacterized coiled-coil protein SlyX